MRGSRRWLSRAGLSVVLGSVVAAGCATSAPPEAPVEIEELRRQVANVRASVEARLATETILQGSGLREADVALRLATPLLLETVSRATREYLQDVTLDLQPDAVVREGADVRVSLGPVRVRAGRWDLVVTIRRIQARLRSGRPEITVVDPGSEARLEVTVPVEVLEGSGLADIDFRWDATGAARAVCRDFRVQETFAATVSPRTYELAGELTLRLAGADGAFLDPGLQQRLLVEPEPTAQSWRRVRELLDREDRIFRCGLALDADEMEARLRDLLRRGFRFSLPESLLRPMSLPGHVAESVTVSGRRLQASATAVGVRLGRDWLWSGLDLALQKGAGSSAIPRR